jgi:hypothetical protein
MVMKTSFFIRPASVLVSLALVLGACAKDTDAPSDSTSSVVAAPPDSTASVPTTDPNVTVVQDLAIDQLKLTSGGGFTTWQYNVSTLPIAWIRGDTLYRGVANETMNPLISKATQQSFNRKARESVTELLSGAGFIGEPLDFGDPGITDNPTTTLEFVLDGKTYRHDAYALGVGPEVAAGLTDEQQKNRANLTSLIEMISDPVASYGAENVSAPTDFKPTLYALWGQILSGSSSPTPGQTETPWPHDSTPLTAFSDNIACRDVSEADAAAVAATFTSAAEPPVSSVEAEAKTFAPQTNTIFVQGEVRAYLVLVPVFPGLDGCPAIS